MESIISSLVTQKAALEFYSPYNFLRGITNTQSYKDNFGVDRINQFASDSVHNVISDQEGGKLLYTELPWDSNFFNCPTYKLLTGLFLQEASLRERVDSVRSFENDLASKGNYYCFSEVPCEDTLLLQTLTASGWQLIETRLLYYRDNLQDFNGERYSVRLAQMDDADRIAQISALARNEYDRFHADPWFGNAKADSFLAHYASAAVKGYCDAVLVPDEPGLPLDSFLAISDLKNDSLALGVGLSRIALTAVGPLNRGWHLKLVSESVHRAREKGDEAILMTTQSTNRAVFRTSEKLGFKLGGSSHVLACHNKLPDR